MSVPVMMLDTSRRRLGVATFLLIAVGVSWTSWLIAHLVGYSLANPVVQLVTAAFLPAVAAVIVRRFVTKEGFADSGLRLRLRPAWKMYVAAGVVNLGALGVALVVAALTGSWKPDASWLFSRNTLIFVMLAPLVSVFAAPLYWGEEYGWTSYLRMRLFPGRPILATVSTGVIWGVWHWPLSFLGYFDEPQTATDIAIGLGLWVVLSVLVEINLSWFYWRSGTIWTTSVAHAGNNLVLAAGLEATLTNQAHLSLNHTTILMCAGLLPLAMWNVANGHLYAVNSVAAP